MKTPVLVIIIGITIGGFRDPLFSQSDGVNRVLFSIPSGGGFSTVSRGIGGLTSGYAEVHGDVSSVEGFAIFGSRQNGVLVSEAAVPMTPFLRNGRVYAERTVTIDRQTSTGLAIANTSEGVATISFFFTTSTGSDYGHGTFTIPGRSQMAAFLHEAPFNGWSGSDNHTLTFSSSIPVAAVALRGRVNERGEYLMTTLSIADLDHPSRDPVRLAHFACGNGWSTEVVLVNPTDERLEVQVTAWWDTRFATGALTTIPPRSSILPRICSANSAVESGSLTVGTNGIAPSATAILRFRQNGAVVTEAGVPPTRIGKAFRVYDYFSQTGIAIANPNFVDAAVNVEVFDLSGAPTGITGAVTLGSGAHIAKFLNQIPGLESLPQDFEGIVRLSSTADFSVIALRGLYNERGEFLIATTPPVRENSGISDSSNNVVPHIADGAGYATQFILVNESSVAVQSGSLETYSASGQALSILR